MWTQLKFSNLIGCTSNKPQVVSAEISMNLGGIDVGKVVGAQGNSSQGSECAGTNTSKDMVKVFLREEGCRLGLENR